MKREKKWSFYDLKENAKFESGTNILQGNYGKRLVAKNKDFRTLLKQANTYTSSDNRTPSDLIHTYFNVKNNTVTISSGFGFSGNKARLGLQVRTFFKYDANKIPKNLSEFKDYVAKNQQLQEIDKERMPFLAKYILDNNLIINMNKLSNKINAWRLYYKKKYKTIKEEEKIGITVQANVQCANINSNSFEDYVFKKESSGIIIPYRIYTCRINDLLVKYNPRFSDCIYTITSAVEKMENGQYEMLETGVVVGLEQNKNELKTTILGTSNLDEFVNKGWRSTTTKRKLEVFRDIYYEESNNLSLSGLFKNENNQSIGTIIARNIRSITNPFEYPFEKKDLSIDDHWLNESVFLAQEIGRKFVDEKIGYQQIPIKVWLLTLILIKKYRYKFFTVLEENNEQLKSYAKNILAKLDANSSKNIEDLQNQDKKEIVVDENIPKITLKR